MRITNSIAGALITGAITAIGCNDIKPEPKPKPKKQYVQVEEIPPLARALDLKREALQEQEKEFIRRLDFWAFDYESLLVISGALIVDSPKPREKEQLENLYKEFIFNKQRYLRECNVENDEKFFEEPTKDQNKYFIEYVSIASEISMLLRPHLDLPEDEMAKKIEKNIKENWKEMKSGLRAGADQQKAIEALKNAILLILKGNREKAESLSLERFKLIQAIASFNKDAQAIKQPQYEPKWGFNIEKLQALKCFDKKIKYGDSWL